MANITDLIQKVADSTAKVVGLPTTEQRDKAIEQREADKAAREAAAQRGTRRA